MGVSEEDRLIEALIEAIEEAEALTEWSACPRCGLAADLLRMVARHTTACYWVVFCSGCGQFLKERWNLLP